MIVQNPQARNPLGKRDTPSLTFVLDALTLLSGPVVSWFLFQKALGGGQEGVAPLVSER